MVDSRVYTSHIRLWFSHWQTALHPQFLAPRVDSATDLEFNVHRVHFDEGVPDLSAANPAYLFCSQAWFCGIRNSKDTSAFYTDGSAKVVSIMPAINPKRKIVNRIKISCSKNIVPKHEAMLEFTLLRVKISLYDVNRTSDNGLRKKTYATPPLVGFEYERNDLKSHKNSYICDNDLQLVDRGSFFSSSEVVLDNLDYDLGFDDLLLIQKISFDKSIEDGTVGKDKRNLNFGISRKRFAEYKIEVEYSYGYM